MRDAVKAVIPKPNAKPAPDVACGVGEHAARAPAPAPPKSDEAFARAAALFRAAGEVTRLRILARLADGEWCVSELAESLSVPLPAVSQHLGVLRAQRIVAHRRAGKHFYYSLLDGHVIDLIRNALEHAAEDKP